MIPVARVLVLIPFLCIAAATAVASTSFPTAEDAVRALIAAVKAGNIEEVRKLFGPESEELIAADQAASRRNMDVFSVATSEGWHLVERDERTRTLVVGNEQWPFPVPLVRDGSGWRFDGAAGREEVVARRIGRNELAVIRICRTYVAAQRRYAQTGHDGQVAGLFATKFTSDPGRQNGLYWPAGRGETRSPLGDLVAQAAQEGTALDTPRGEPAPFHGYYFKILTAQGPSAAGGPRDYIVMGGMSRGFALVAWPARHDVSGIMTFIVNHDGVIYEKDLGAETAAVASRMTLFEPDPTWERVKGGGQ
jgi:hypothetical protein